MTGTTLLGRSFAVHDPEPEYVRSALQSRDARPIPRCHPEKPIYTAGLCHPCYRARREARGFFDDELFEGRQIDPEPVMAPRVQAIAAERPPERLWARRLMGRNPRLTPGPDELAALLAVVEHSTQGAAAASLGIPERTLVSRLVFLYVRIGAKDRAHAAWLLWPILRDRYRLPCDTPVERRRAA